MSKAEQFDLRLNRRQMMLIGGAACACGMGNSSVFGDVAVNPANDPFQGDNIRTFFCTSRGVPSSEHDAAIGQLKTQSPAVFDKLRQAAPVFSRSPAEQKKYQMTIDKGWKWGKREITYRYLPGGTRDSNLISEIEKAFNDWHPHCGLDFREVSSGGDIKIGFFDDGYWSYIGSYATQQINQTMNIQPGNPSEYRRAALHEIGHALGAIHEHQSPVAGRIPWNEDALYAYYWNRFRWQPQTVREQVIEMYNNGRVENLEGSPFDKKCIMAYVIPDIVLLPGAPKNFVVPDFNTELSLTDKNIMRHVYGQPKLADDGGGQEEEQKIVIQSDRQKIKAENAKAIKPNEVVTGEFPSDPQMHLYKFTGVAKDYVLETVDGAMLGAVIGNAMPVVLELFDGTDFSDDKAIAVSKFGDLGSIGVQDAFLKTKPVEGTTYYVVVRPQQRLKSGSKALSYKLLLRAAPSDRVAAGITGKSWSDLKDEITTRASAIEKVQADTASILKGLRK